MQVLKLEMYNKLYSFLIYQAFYAFDDILQKSNDHEPLRSVHEYL